MNLPGSFFKRHKPPAGLLRPDPVFILGMHRSGTSALSGALEPLGLTVGKSVMPPHAGQGNPKGFYENLPLTKLHDKFLKSIGSSWAEPKPVNQERWEGRRARRFREKLLQLLIEEFGGDRPLIKDPRMCRLMPLWIPLIQEYFPRAGFVLPIRHPVEVAHSLRQRDQLTLDEGLKLWVVHVLEGERNTRGFPRQFTTYDQLVQSPAETVLRLAKNLGLSENEAAAAASRQIDSNLRHHAELPWPEGEPCQDLTLGIYQALVSDQAGKEEKLDRLRQEYYGKMGWGC
jgi:O-antigen biosynthesis protein